jgi:hypothetical protein
MAEMKIIRNDGGTAISVPADASKLEINEPVSTLANLAEVIRSMPCLETLVFYVTDYGKIDSSRSLSFLKGVKGLKGLSLRSMSHLQGCGAISECESLEWLSLSRHTTKVFDFSALLPLHRLKRLYVEMPDNHMLDISPTPTPPSQTRTITTPSAPSSPNTAPRRIITCIAANSLTRIWACTTTARGIWIRIQGGFGRKMDLKVGC